MAFDYKKMCQRELNVGAKDQQIRYWVGGAALLLSVFLGNVFLLIVGAALVASAYLRWCPVYSGMGKSTLEPSEAEKTAVPQPEKAEAAPAETAPTPAKQPEAPARKHRAKPH